MIVRFDNKAVQQTVAKEVEPIGVEGDPATRAGGITESEAIVLETKKKLDEGGEGLDRIPDSLLEPQKEHHAEPGPELNPEALEKARKDGGGTAST